MKENCTIAKAHLVENFLQDLMAEHTEKDDRVTFTKVSSLHVLLKELCHTLCISLEEHGLNMNELIMSLIHVSYFSSLVFLFACLSVFDFLLIIAMF